MNTIEELLQGFVWFAISDADVTCGDNRTATISRTSRIAIPPVFLCFGVSSVFGSGLIFATGVIYGLMSLGRKWELFRWTLLYIFNYVVINSLYSTYKKMFVNEKGVEQYFAPHWNDY